MAYPTRQSTQPAPGRGGPREKTQLGRFHFGHAILTGVIVREDPVKRFSQRGTPWTQATILVDLYDSRQKKEREKPAFVRLVAFNEQAEILDGFERRNRIHAAGRLVIDMYQDREGNIREGYELQADRIAREPFPKLDALLPKPAGLAAASPPREDMGPAGPPPAAYGDEPLPAGTTGAYEDDVPF